MNRQSFVMFYTLAALAVAPAVFAANPIQIENAKPGSPDWVHYRSAVNREIEGYASATSVTYGEEIKFFVSSAETSYILNVYRMGWYGGVGARKVVGPVTRSGFQQPMPQPDSRTGLVECNWTSPYSLTIPSDWTTGIYLVKLSLPGSRADSYIPFVVRDDASQANHNFQLSVTTWQAYNAWGGKSLYPKSSTGGVPADIVSFDRPYDAGNGTGQFLWRWEYNMVRFLEREGYDLSYSTNLDTHSRGSLLANHRSFLSVGHDEYWSWQMRANVEAALAAGVDLGFFTANAAYWQVRFEPSGSGTANRRMVGYKEDAATKDPYATDSDPSNNHLITSTFRDPNAANRPEAALIGVQYVDDQIDGDIRVHDVTSAPWVFESTGLAAGSIIPGLLGYEVDAMITGVTPAGTIRLARSPYTTTDTGATGYSDMTVRTAASGGIVFATGTIQWSWGLDDWNTVEHGERVSAAAQQITRNVLRRFAGPTAAAADCLFTVEPKPAQLPPDSGSRTVNLTTASSCSWTVSSSADWLRVTSQTSGSGSTAVTYTFTTNTGATRTATLTIADKTFNVTQSGCTYTLSPQGATAPSTGGQISVAVTTSASCPWTAVSQVPWISVSSASTASGSGTVTLSVASTVGPARSGTVVIAGTPFVVNQTSGCTFSYPASQAMPASGGTRSLSISASASDCPWTVTTTTSWITITSAASGIGNGAVTYSVAPNNSSVSRDGELRINGRRYDIHQLPGSPSTAPTRIAPNDFNGDGMTDLVWRHTAGTLALWTMNVRTIIDGSPIGSLPDNWQIQGYGDFFGDRKWEIILRNSADGMVAFWEMNGHTLVNGAAVATVAHEWQIELVGDFNGDGRSDLIWRNRNTAQVAMWEMNGRTILNGATFITLPLDWKFETVGDFNRDGRQDIIVRNVNSGQVALWEMNGRTLLNGAAIMTVPLSWQIQDATGDFNGDGYSDLIWRHTDGSVAMWEMNVRTILNGAAFGSLPPEWQIRSAGHYDSDANSDIFLYNTSTGLTALWQMNGHTLVNGAAISPVPLAWRPQTP